MAESKAKGKLPIDIMQIPCYHSIRKRGKHLMMNWRYVYIVLHYYPYEGYEVVRVFMNKNDADRSAKWRNRKLGAERYRYSSEEFVVERKRVH